MPCKTLNLVSCVHCPQGYPQNVAGFAKSLARRAKQILKNRLTPLVKEEVVYLGAGAFISTIIIDFPQVMILPSRGVLDETRRSNIRRAGI